MRNRIRRRLREMVRCHRQEIPAGWDFVIHPKSSVATAAPALLTADLLRLLKSRELPTPQIRRGVRAALFALRVYKSYLSVLFAGRAASNRPVRAMCIEAIERFGRDTRNVARAETLVALPAVFKKIWIRSRAG